MKVKDLIELLQKENPDALVVCVSDSDSNFFSPLYDVVGGEEQGYCPLSDVHGERRFRTLTPGLNQMGFTEDEVDREAIPALYLFPTI